MELRKIEIKPEYRDRLWELLKIHEKEIDQMSEAELDQAEHRLSGRIVHLIQGVKPTRVILFKRKTFPVRAGATVFLAAAAAMLFMQMNLIRHSPNEMVSKGMTAVSALDCETKLLQVERPAPEKTDSGYILSVHHASYLKFTCDRSVFVYLAVQQNENLQLLKKNLSLSDPDHLLEENQQLLDFTGLAKTHPSVFIIASEKSLGPTDLLSADRKDLWIEEMQLHLQN
jgi:hypothetical protein